MHGWPLLGWHCVMLIKYVHILLFCEPTFNIGSKRKLILTDSPIPSKRKWPNPGSVVFQIQSNMNLDIQYLPFFLFDMKYCLLVTWLQSNGVHSWLLTISKVSMVSLACHNILQVILSGMDALTGRIGSEHRVGGWIVSTTGRVTQPSEIYLGKNVTLSKL